MQGLWLDLWWNHRWSRRWNTVRYPFWWTWPNMGISWLRTGQGSFWRSILMNCSDEVTVVVNKKRPPEFLLKVSEGWRLPTLPLGIAVPSALTGLTSLFGMGRGGSPSLLPPLSISFVLASARTGRCGGPTVYDGERKNFSIYCFVYLFSTRSTTEVSGY